MEIAGEVVREVARSRTELDLEVREWRERSEEKRERNQKDSVTSNKFWSPLRALSLPSQHAVNARRSLEQGTRSSQNFVTFRYFENFEMFAVQALAEKALRRISKMLESYRVAKYLFRVRLRVEEK